MRALFFARRRSSPTSTRRSATPRSRPARPQAYDPADPQARKARHGGDRRRLLAVCDFVGSDKSLQFATGVLARGGKVVVTGLLGGNFSIAAAMFGIKAMTIEGTLTGTLAEARELLDLARAGKYRADPDPRSAARARRRPRLTISAPAGSSAAPC